MPHLPVVILVRPQMGENIGAVARAMSNFGLKELRLAAPRDGWPNPRAMEMAAAGGYIIEAATAHADFHGAMADIQIAYATTARPRDMEKRVIDPAAAGTEIRAHIAAGVRVGLVFGPERTGLENEEITRCDTLITIPTAVENSSLNLAQSMVVLGYEWFRHAAPAVARDAPEMATKSEWQGLFGQLEAYLDEVNYYRVANKKTVMWQNLQNILQRAPLSSQEVRSLRGVLRSLWERKQRNGA